MCSRLSKYGSDTTAAKGGAVNELTGVDWRRKAAKVKQKPDSPLGTDHSPPPPIPTQTSTPPPPSPLESSLKNTTPNKDVLFSLHYYSGWKIKVREHATKSLHVQKNTTNVLCGKLLKVIIIITEL